MAEITTLAMEEGESRLVKITGRTRAGKVAKLETVEVTIDANPEAFTVETVEVAPDFVVLVSCLRAEGGLLGVKADGRIGDGVFLVNKSLPLSGVAADAVDIAFEEVVANVDQPPAPPEE